MKLTDIKDTMKETNIHDALPLCCVSNQVDRRDTESMSATAKFVFPKNFVGFAGHFPEKSILPAVVQLTAIRYIAEQALNIPLQLVSYGRIKFSEIIQPEEQVEIAITLNNTNNAWHGVFTVNKENQKITAGSCDFTQRAL